MTTPKDFGINGLVLGDYKLKVSRFAQGGDKDRAWDRSGVAHGKKQPQGVFFWLKSFRAVLRTS